MCVENYSSRPDGIYACNIKISEMSKDLEGDWTVEVTSGRTSEEIEAEVVLIGNYIN